MHLINCIVNSYANTKKSYGNFELFTLPSCKSNVNFSSFINSPGVAGAVLQSPP